MTKEEDDPFEEVPGSESKEYGPWFKCKVHGGYFTESDKEPHVRAYHSKKNQGAQSRFFTHNGIVEQ